MTAAAVSPVIPPAPPVGRADDQPSRQANSRRALPMPQLPTLRDRSMVYGTAAIDCNGRVAEATVINALGWVPGTRLNIRESGGLVLVTADHHGVFTMTTRGPPAS